MADLSPSQTIGPFFHDGGRWLVQSQQVPTDWLAVVGAVFDAEGKGVSDAMLEISTASQETCLQRVFTDDQGSFRFHLPAGAVGHVTLFARGLLRHLFTRVYLDAALVPAEVPAARRATLVARLEGTQHRWDIRLRGEGETVFFALA